jgi:hypothetical protein
MLLLALYPSVSWDADTYHLGVPRLWLDHGGFREIPFNVYSNWPLATELLFSMDLMARGLVSSRLLHCFFCERDYVADSFFHASQVADWARKMEGEEALTEGFRALGITHVLVARKDWGLAFPPHLAAVLEDQERVETRYESPSKSHRVLRLR